jgi:hypothetical protein
MDELVAYSSKGKALADFKALASALELADAPEEINEIEARLAGIQAYMRDAGLYSTVEIRPVNETLMLARWKLGRALAKMERRQGERTDKGTSSTGLTKLLARLGTTKQTAMEAQRIGTLPEPGLKKALDESRKLDVLTTFATLIKLARPYWYAASRKTKHKTIHAKAAAINTATALGPFPLILADPRWRYEKQFLDEAMIVLKSHEAKACVYFAMVTINVIIAATAVTTAPTTMSSMLCFRIKPSLSEMRMTADGSRRSLLSQRRRKA